MDYGLLSSVLHLTETWKWALDENLKVGALFIDFKKAYHLIAKVEGCWYIRKFIILDEKLSVKSQPNLFKVMK